MANPIWPETRIGTIGELLVQLRLLQYGVQAAAPLKDSGNDLIALKGLSIRCVQIKTSTSGVPAWPPSHKLYHLLAVVKLEHADNDLRLDQSAVYLLSREEVRRSKRSWSALDRFRLNQNRIDLLFCQGQ
jgi:hypothetical protein